MLRASLCGNIKNNNGMRMGYIVINDEEYGVLTGQPHAWLVTYLAIKRYIDWDSCIAGVKRRISEQYLRERLEVETQQGRHKPKSISRKNIRNYIEGLGRIGLLEARKNFVFFLPKADAGVPDLKYEGPMKGQKKGRVKGQKNNDRRLENTDVSKYEGPYEGTTNSEMKGPPPDLNINIINNINNMSFFDKFWTEYPRKEKKKNTKEIWVRKKLDAIAEKIISDVKLRKEKHKAWAEGFIPHASTYLNGERWNDAIISNDISIQSTIADETCEEIINGVRCTNIVTMIVKGKKKLCREHYKP